MALLGFKLLFYIAQVWKRSSLKEIKFGRDRVWNWVGPSTSKLDLCLFNSVVSNEHRLQEIVYRAAWLVQKRYLLSPTSWMATPTKQSCSLTSPQHYVSCICMAHVLNIFHLERSTLEMIEFGRGRVWKWVAPKGVVHMHVYPSINMIAQVLL